MTIIFKNDIINNSYISLNQNKFENGYFIQQGYYIDGMVYNEKRLYYDNKKKALKAYSGLKYRLKKSI